jgi:hypothetical protein
MALSPGSCFKKPVGSVESKNGGKGKMQHKPGNRCGARAHGLRKSAVKKQSTARAQQSISPHTAHKKLRKPNRGLRKRNSDSEIAQAQRGTKEFNHVNPTKALFVTAAPTKTAEAQQDASKSQLQQKDAQARRETKRPTTRAQQSIFHCAAQMKNAKAQQETPKAQFRH